MSASLACKVEQNFTPPPWEGKQKAILDGFYRRYGVLDKGPEEKIGALMKVIQNRTFFASGGGTTVELELKANERIYLLQHERLSFRNH